MSSNFGNTVIILTLVLGSSGLSLAGEPELSALTACVDMDDDVSRLHCYDVAAGRLSPPVEQEREAPVVDRESAGEALAPLSDDIGNEELSAAERDPAEQVAVQATVIGCRRNRERKYYFEFDNGQIWKQKDDDRLKYDVDCNLEVTIVKGFFGYKMQIEGRQHPVSIGRIK